MKTMKSWLKKKYSPSLLYRRIDEIELRVEELTAKLMKICKPTTSDLFLGGGMSSRIIQHHRLVTITEGLFLASAILVLYFPIMLVFAK